VVEVDIGIRQFNLHQSVEAVVLVVVTQWVLPEQLELLTKVTQEATEAAH
jgi:hypothetical protein